MSDPFIQFDKGRPFFEMVGTFLVALSACPAMFNKDNPLQLDKTKYIVINGVHVPGKHLIPFEVFEQVQAGHLSMPQFLASCCAMLANTAYESVKDLNDRSPEFEFLRHVRNASSHGNLFHFVAHEPSRPAAWRGATIDHTRRGVDNPLHAKPCFGPVLAPADLVELLADVERRIAA